MSNTTDPAKVVSPKVIAGAIGSAIAGALGAGVVAAVAVITPDHFAGLGIWGPVVFAGVTVTAGTLGGYVAGWATRDPLRR